MTSLATAIELLQPPLFVRDRFSGTRALTRDAILGIYRASY